MGSTDALLLSFVSLRDGVLRLEISYRLLVFEFELFICLCFRHWSIQ